MDQLKLQEHDVVALLHDLPGEGLVRGQVGAIVDISEATGTVLVEFCDPDGQTLAIPTLRPADLLPLHYEKVAAE